MKINFEHIILLTSIITLVLGIIKTIDWFKKNRKNKYLYLGIILITLLLIFVLRFITISIELKSTDSNNPRKSTTDKPRNINNNEKIVFEWVGEYPQVGGIKANLFNADFSDLIDVKKIPIDNDILLVGNYYDNSAPLQISWKLKQIYFFGCSNFSTWSTDWSSSGCNTFSLYSFNWESEEIVKTIEFENQISHWKINKNQIFYVIKNVVYKTDLKSLKTSVLFDFSDINNPVLNFQVFNDKVFLYCQKWQQDLKENKIITGIEYDISTDERITIPYGTYDWLTEFSTSNKEKILFEVGKEVGNGKDYGEGIQIVTPDTEKIEYINHSNTFYHWINENEFLVMEKEKLLKIDKKLNITSEMGFIKSPHIINTFSDTFIFSELTDDDTNTKTYFLSTYDFKVKKPILRKIEKGKIIFIEEINKNY